MRRLTIPALALVALLLIAAPALALGDDMDSEHQTQGYGKIAAYVCGGIAAIVLLIGGVHVIKGFLAEAERQEDRGHDRGHPGRLPPAQEEGPVPGREGARLEGRPAGRGDRGRAGVPGPGRRL